MHAGNKEGRKRQPIVVRYSIGLGEVYLVGRSRQPWLGVANQGGVHAMVAPWLVKHYDRC